MDNSDAIKDGIDRMHIWMKSKKHRPIDVDLPALILHERLVKFVNGLTRMVLNVID